MSDPISSTHIILTDEQRLDWLQLIRSENVGPQTFRALVNRFGGASNALHALPDLSRQRGRVLQVAARDDCERELSALHALGGRLLALGEAEYPAPLRAIQGAPPLIAVRGDVAVLQRPMVAIVGSRNASAAGLTFAERIARDLGSEGFVVVSGLARGIDARAHRASLQTGAVAALAGGLDVVYPPEHEPLAQEIAACGVLVSEMPLGWEPRGRDFPRRNRLVSGLSRGVLVVEAAKRSGSLITARFAVEQGREVFAVPGSPFDPRAEGTNSLIREGATLCTRSSDIVGVLRPILSRSFNDSHWREEDEVQPEALWDEWSFEESAAPQAAAVGIPREEQKSSTPRSRMQADGSGPRAQGGTRETIENLLSASPIALDDLVRAAGVSVSEAQVALFELELERRILRHSGNLVSLTVGPVES